MGAINPYKTFKKVFAEGARVGEVPLPECDESVLEDYVEPTSRRQRRRMFRMLRFGAVPGYAPICLDTNDPQTLKAGLCRRLVRKTPTPDPATMARFQEFVARFVAKLPRVDVLPFEEWLAGTTYNEKRKNELREAYAALKGGEPTARQCSHVDSFIKSEFYPEYKHARWINSRSDAFKVFTGPAFKAIERIIYALPEFIKHVPVSERPSRVAALRQAGLRYFQTDYTSFESHFTSDFLKVCEGQLYNHCLAGLARPRFITSVLAGVNRLRTRTGFRVNVEGRRMSGDMCTSLGNGFTNLMLAMFVASEEGMNINGFVEGDDGIFACEKPLREEMFARLGFTIKIVEHADPLMASFCGVVSGPDLQMLRDPRTFLQGFGWTQSFINAGNRIMDELLLAKSLSALHETPQCPIVSVMAREAYNRTCHLNPRFVQDGYHVAIGKFVPEAYAPTYKTRLAFEAAFGISPAIQEAAEDAIREGDMERLAVLVPASEHSSHFAGRYVVVT